MSYLCAIPFIRVTHIKGNSSFCRSFNSFFSSLKFFSLVSKVFVAGCSLFFGGGLQLGKKAAPLQSQTGESVDRKGAQRGRQEKKQKKFCGIKKPFYLCRPKRGTVPEALKDLPEKTRKALFSRFRKGPKKNKKKISGHSPGEQKKC